VYLLNIDGNKVDHYGDVFHYRDAHDNVRLYCNAQPEIIN